MDKLREVLIKKMREMIPTQVLLATVKSVDKQALSIDIILQEDNIELHDVRLIPALESAGSSIVCIPAVGSMVLVGIIANMPSANYMVMCQQADEIILRGGSEGGLIKVKELKKQMRKDTEILQALLNVIAGPTIPEPGNGSPSALQISLKAAFAGRNPGNYDNIENTKVTHG